MKQRGIRLHAREPPAHPPDAGPPKREGRPSSDLAFSRCTPPLVMSMYHPQGGGLGESYGPGQGQELHGQSSFHQSSGGHQYYPYANGSQPNLSGSVHQPHSLNSSYHQQPYSHQYPPPLGGSYYPYGYPYPPHPTPYNNPPYPPYTYPYVRSDSNPALPTSMTQRAFSISTEFPV